MDKILLKQILLENRQEVENYRVHLSKISPILSNFVNIGKNRRDLMFL